MSETSKPEGKIFEEMDQLAKKIATKLMAKGHQSDWMEGTIREQLDEWVTKRVVRFQLSNKCEPDEILKDGEHRAQIEAGITLQMIRPINAMCGLRETNQEERRHYLTLYVMAFKDNF